MNTKTNYEYTSNSYNGGIIRNDSPAALLDMLAEVASQTLHSEKKHSKSLLASQCKSKVECTKRKTQESLFNVQQLLSMPASQLVKQFSIFTSDELKRQYSYTCALINGCSKKYTSFASEGRARMSIKVHLAEHLEYLKTNKEAYKTFTAKSVNYKNHKTSLLNKKSRLQQSRKPQETLNKENKNVIVEKPTNYLRNILLNDSSFKELNKNKSFERVEKPKKLHNSEQKDIDRTEFKVLGDHSYFERLKEEIPNGSETESFSSILENTTTDENIVLMVVGTDTVHMKEYSHVNQKLSEKFSQESETIYLPEMTWLSESCNKNADTIATKPKGKAKFIGTSKEEREMALAFMDRIKKKGNPTGSNLQCRICNPPRSFTAPTTLVSHYRSHAGIKPYECRICRAVFTRRHSLKYHMLIHQNQTRFTCADCGKKFRHPSHFREHRRRHTGEAPFGCDDCGQRFKTRNTYKRHLKTRHGKVLTTTGELLYLSEEDFQKVRTNRKKKNDVSKEHVADESIIAAKTIMHYQNDNNNQLQGIVADEYIIKEGTDDDKNWESNDTIRIIKDCFETYEVYPESQLKTELVETEISIDNKICNRNENNLPEEYTEVQENLSQLQSISYNKLEVIRDEKDEIVCHDNINQSELIHRNISKPSSYIEIKYEDDIQFQENVELSENRLESHVEIMNHTSKNYGDGILNNSVTEQQVDYIENVEETGDILLNQNDECLLEGDETSSNYQAGITDLTKDQAIASPSDVLEKSQKLLHQTKQRLYIHNQPLTGIIVQNKCINIVPHKLKACNDQENKSKTKLDKGQNFTFLNKCMQAVNIKQNVNENTILLLTNDTLQNSVLKIDQNNTADNEIKKQTFERSK
ncbi:uncharacterized protein LOC128895310 isoform X1 [Hylaeus anthracinus]|uniref:uncharacterized protein LOC128895310 isoform X1 n=1 Tax=Hylaeus anthracinus TaxID=313031 RepID=UPI0023B91B87|nr:uncharacterized protein LOC128895310 isoform X1 [Hylaeus anthracinus]